MGLVQVLDNKIEDQELNEKIAEILLKVDRELDYTERYMLAYHDAMQKNLKDTQYYGRITMRAPHWHEVKQNFLSYPTLRERVSRLKDGQG